MERSPLWRSNRGAHLSLTLYVLRRKIAIRRKVVKLSRRVRHNAAVEIQSTSYRAMPWLSLGPEPRLTLYDPR